LDVGIQETVLEVAQFKTAEPLVSSSDKEKVRAVNEEPKSKVFIADYIEL
jgi:hypothetical protein